MAKKGRLGSELGCLWLKAKNDANGNPRRLFVEIEVGEMTGTGVTRVKDEGHSGRPEWESCRRNLIGVEITPGEYRRFKKEHKDGLEHG